MKKKNEQWLRYSNRALSGLLMLFGFVSCDNGGGDIPVEYGMPSAKYRVKGKVIDADTQEPVPGIKWSPELCIRAMAKNGSVIRIR